MSALRLLVPVLLGCALVLTPAPACAAPAPVVAGVSSAAQTAAPTNACAAARKRSARARARVKAVAIEVRRHEATSADLTQARKAAKAARARATKACQAAPAPAPDPVPVATPVATPLAPGARATTAASAAKLVASLGWGNDAQAQRYAVQVGQPASEQLLKDAAIYAPGEPLWLVDAVSAPFPGLLAVYGHDHFSGERHVTYLAEDFRGFVGTSRGADSWDEPVRAVPDATQPHGLSYEAQYLSGPYAGQWHRVG